MDELSLVLLRVVLAPRARVAELVGAVWVLLALAFRALRGRSAVCCARLRWCNLRRLKKYSMPGVLGAAPRRLWKELVMVKKSRESCSSSCVATTARLDERCGVGGRWEMDLRSVPLVGGGVGGWASCRRVLLWLLCSP